MPENRLSKNLYVIAEEGCSLIEEEYLKEISGYVKNIEEICGVPRRGLL